MALIDKEQICAEIKRLVKLNKECAKEGGDAVFLEGIAAGYADVISFLNSLPEQPASEELEEAAHNFAIHYDNGTCDGIAQDCFIAGAEWQKAKDQKTIELAEDHAMLAGMNKMEQQIVSIIESRIKEIIGDAQPNPVLRIELQGIIDKIK